MCGIFGTINYRISEETFKHRLDLLKHRGPDGYGIWNSEDSSIKIGHRRLAIIDISNRARQPMIFNERYILTFNGEIYNYIELRESLIKQGVNFTSHSDTEVLLQLIILKGPEALLELNGMWSFVLYDKQEKSFLMSRDRQGEKPLYYIHEGDKFAFASEMKSLYNCLDEFNYNKEFIDYYVTNPYDNELFPETIIHGIKKFPAGHYAKLSNGKLEIVKYYFPELLQHKKEKYQSIEDSTEHFKELFLSSCKLRMRSDVNIGSSLSGGIDSGLVLNNVSQQFNDKTSTYRAVVSCFPGSVLDETENAIQIADKANVNAILVNVDPQANPEQLLQSIYDFEDIAGTSPIPFFQTYQAFRDNGILVTLDGHGGDELFGGYSFDIPSKLSDDFPNVFKMRDTLQTLEDMGGYDKKISLGLAWLYLKQEYQRRKIQGLPILKNLSAYNNKLHHSTFKGILPTLLRNYDKYSMHAGVEVRMPFLDYRIVEFVFKLPNEHKVNDGFSKVLLRNAAKGLLPDNIINNKVKKGWNSPMGEWFSGIWKEWLLDEISSVDFANSTIVDPIDIARLVNSFLTEGKKNQDTGQLIWLRMQPYFILKANRIFHQFKD